MKLGFSPLFLEYFSIFLRFFSEFFDQIFFTQNAQNGLKSPLAHRNGQCEVRNIFISVIGIGKGTRKTP